MAPVGWVVLATCGLILYGAYIEWEPPNRFIGTVWVLLLWPAAIIGGLIVLLLLMKGLDGGLSGEVDCPNPNPRAC